jgi:ubiquitin-protein ligase
LSSAGLVLFRVCSVQSLSSPEFVPSMVCQSRICRCNITMQSAMCQSALHYRDRSSHPSQHT